MTAGTLFVALLLGHLVGDWLVQTDRQAAEKTTSWAAMARHVAGYHLALSGAVWLVWPAGRPLTPAIAVVAASALTHALIDRRWPTIRLMRAIGNAKLAEQTWGIFVVDQTLHLSILAACALVVGD